MFEKYSNKTIGLIHQKNQQILINFLEFKHNTHIHLILRILISHMDPNTETIRDFESDNGLMKVLMNNFGSVLVFIFYAEWNESSKQFLANLKQSIPIFGQYDNVKYFSFCAERSPETFQKFNVEKTPTVIFTQSNKEVLFRYEEDDVGSLFDQLALTSEQHKEQFQRDMLIWHPKAKSVVESCPVIIFAKGTPTNPKCGFTRTMFGIMKDHNVEYAFYDIIEDQNMRHWLRHYINWPTYPMIFINGKLIGGLDTVKNLVGVGEFSKMIPESSKIGSPEQRYNQFISDNETVIFSNGFPFENKLTENLVEKAGQKYGENVRIYNTDIDQSLKTYLVDSLAKNLPFVVHQKNIVEL